MKAGAGRTGCEGTTNTIAEPNVFQGIKRRSKRASTIVRGGGLPSLLNEARDESGAIRAPVAVFRSVEHRAGGRRLVHRFSERQVLDAVLAAELGKQRLEIPR